MSSCIGCLEQITSLNRNHKTSLLCSKCFKLRQECKEKEDERDHCRHCGCSTPSCHKVCDRCLRFDMAKQEVMEKYSGVFESLAKIEAQELNVEFAEEIEKLRHENNVQREHIDFLQDAFQKVIDQRAELTKNYKRLESTNDVLLTKNKQLEEQLTRQTNEMNDLRKLLSVGG